MDGNVAKPAFAHRATDSAPQNSSANGGWPLFDMATVCETVMCLPGIKLFFVDLVGSFPDPGRVGAEVDADVFAKSIEPAVDAAVAG